MAAVAPTGICGTHVSWQRMALMCIPGIGTASTTNGKFNAFLQTEGAYRQFQRDKTGAEDVRIWARTWHLYSLTELGNHLTSLILTVCSAAYSVLSFEFYSTWAICSLGVVYSSAFLFFMALAYSSFQEYQESKKRILNYTRQVLV